MTAPGAQTRHDPDALAERLLAGDRAALARAITLVESRNPRHMADAQALLARVMPQTGGAIRIGVTGVPGVGKSTTIDQWGANLVEAGHKVAVLAVDPSSTRTGGSILGDKTRMAKLALLRDAFIRPSPSAGTLGGVAAKTREAMLLCEAAGFDVILVETVGTGQSETAVADMVDVFLVLMLPGAGDDLQGIKKGILEIADIVAVNKADGENATRARQAAADYRAALHMLAPASPDWTVPVLTFSGLTNEGLDRLWESVCEHKRVMTGNGAREARRARQAVSWMWSIFDDRMRARLKSDTALAARLPALEADVAAGRMPAGLAAETILKALGLSTT